MLLQHARVARAIPRPPPSCASRACWWRIAGMPPTANSRNCTRLVSVKVRTSKSLPMQSSPHSQTTLTPSPAPTSTFPSCVPMSRPWRNSPVSNRPAQFGPVGYVSLLRKGRPLCRIIIERHRRQRRVKAEKMSIRPITELYHFAEASNLPSILLHRLLRMERLLALAGVADEDRAEIIRRHRPDCATPLNDVA